MLYPQEWLDEVDEDDDQDPKRTNRETRCVLSSSQAQSARSDSPLLSNRVAEYKHRAKLTYVPREISPLPTPDLSPLGSIFDSPVQSLGQFFQLVAATTHHVPTSDLQTINDSIPKIVILSGSLDHLIPTDSSTNREPSCFLVLRTVLMRGASDTIFEKSRSTCRTPS